MYVEAPRRIAGPVLKTFEEQTGIHVDANYRENLGDRFLSTLMSRAGQGTVDLFWGETPLSAYEMVEAGLAVPFRPAGARPVPGQYRDHDFRWIGFAVNPRVIIYNSTALKKEEAPTETTDLVKPPWAGKGAMPRIAAGPAAFHATALFMLDASQPVRCRLETWARRAGRPGRLALPRSGTVSDRPTKPDRTSRTAPAARSNSTTSKEVVRLPALDLLSCSRGALKGSCCIQRSAGSPQISLARLH